MTEFNDKTDELVQRTGAGTDAFKKNVNKRFRLILKITVINSVVFLLNALAIIYQLWPGDAFKTLSGFIFLLSAATIVMGLVGLFVVWLQGYTYNKLAEHNKNRISNNQELWKKMAKLPGGDKNPFETPIGPTDKCLSANQTVSFVKNGETDTDILQHLKDCKICRDHLSRFKKVYP